MYRHCTTEESVLRQRQLEQCLLRIMGEIPYPQITIGYICQQADVSRKSFYRYFGSKDDCLHALIDHCILDGASHYLPEHNARSAARQIYVRFFEYWQQQSLLINALVRNDLSALLVQRMMVHIDQEERDSFNFLSTSSTGPYEQIFFMVCGLAGLIIQWYTSGFQKSPAQMADILTQITTR